MAKSKSFYKKKNLKHKKNSQKIYGGDCGSNAPNWVQQVVGSYPHSAQNGTNVIAQHVPASNISGGSGTVILSPGLVDSVVNNSAPGAAPTLANAIHSGGKKKRSNKRKGGNVLSELAVPAVLLIANQTIGKKTGKKHPYNKQRFSRRYRK